jgi:Zn-dependent M28 family amino/carboxypeptidase
VVRVTRLVAATVCVAAVALAPGSASAANTPSGQAAKLRKAITVEGMMQHQQALQDIASANGNTRASGTPGYDASVDYVVSQLEEAGYDPVVQPFDFAFFRELGTPEFNRVSPSPRTYVAGTEFSTMTYSGSGDVTAPAQHVGDAGGAIVGNGCRRRTSPGSPPGTSR